MKPVATLVAITLLLLAGPLTGAAIAAEPVAEPPAGPLRLELTEVGPRVVTASGPDTLTVVGAITNTGDRPVDDLVVRVQRGNPLRTEGEVRDALDGTAGTDAVTPQFTPLPGGLAPGAQMPVRLTIPLRGAPETGLALSTTGVYELLVNVNGVPEGGGRARLAATRLLLPVLSLPAGAQGADPVFAEEPEPTPFSLLYPITDVPRRVSTVPGQPTLLTDDELAAALAPSGRLGGLLSALTDLAPAGSPVRQSICLAVDPDLVETVAAMRGGYNVRGPDGNPVPGAGAQVAGTWLDALTAAAGDGCIIALPYADADLVALTRGGQAALASGSIVQGRQTLTDLLGVPIVGDATWPADGLIDGPTLAQVARAGNRTVVLSADGVEQQRTPRDSGVLAVEQPRPATGGTDGQTAVLADPLLTAAVTGPTARPDTPAEDVAGRGAAATVASPAGGGGPLSTQDGIGALVFRVQGGDPTDDGPLVLAPPHTWNADGPAAKALLDAVDQLVTAGFLRPRASDAVAPGAPDGPAVPVTYPIDGGGREIPREAVDTVAATAAAVADLRSAAKPGSPVGVSPEEAFAPLERGLVRPASAAWRGRTNGAVTAARAAHGRIDELRASVRVLEPPSPYSLGTKDAPILITVGNELPVTMEVRVEIAQSPGLRVAPIEPQQIPPLGRRQVSVSAEVTRAGQFTVQASVRTPNGELLGPPSRLRMRSTAYGTITLWLTGSAGVLLVVLAARRVVRRIRGEQAPRREIVLGPRSGSAPDSPASAPSPPPPPRPPDPAATAARTGDPFPDPTAVTQRLPTAPDAAEPTERLPTAARATEATDRLPSRPRPRPPRPPEPPRVGSR